LSSGSGIAGLASQRAAIHLMGIGGAGMAGLALLLEARGAAVSGCDEESNETTETLESRGMNVWRGHSAEHVEGHAAVVHTAAVPEDHPELEAARAHGLPVVKRSRALADLVNAGTLVAVAGTHGKTTTTALTALALEAAGLQPTALVGGRIPAWGGNARIAGGDTYVVEADEYDRSFLALRPKLAVITSVEVEHLDTYSTLAELEDAFDTFVDRVPEDGRVIACADDAGARRRLERAGTRGLSYGLGEDAELRAESVTYGAERTRFSARWRGKPLGEFELTLHGRHNVLNALAAIGVMLALGLEPRAAAPALAAFTGVERRFQTLGVTGGVTVVDDYAHHPTEVAATLETARQVFADRRLVVAFQPHLYSRTRAFAAEFGRALAAADLVFVTAIYPAREAPIPGVSARLVVDAARRALDADRVRYAEDLDALAAALEAELRPGDVLVTLGAGDIFGVARRLVAELGRSDVDA
jgi:UDP-N-acetylmuramate--alanine ligase